MQKRERAHTSNVVLGLNAEATRRAFLEREQAELRVRLERRAQELRSQIETPNAVCAWAKGVLIARVCVCVYVCLVSHRGSFVYLSTGTIVVESTCSPVSAGQATDHQRPILSQARMFPPCDEGPVPLSVGAHQSACTVHCLCSPQVRGIIKHVCEIEADFAAVLNARIQRERKKLKINDYSDSMKNAVRTLLVGTNCINDMSIMLAIPIRGPACCFDGALVRYSHYCVCES